MSLVTYNGLAVLNYGNNNTAMLTTRGSCNKNLQHYYQAE